MHRHGAWIMLLFVALLAFRILPLPSLGSLDLLDPAAPNTGPGERAQDNFPGSAFFYVQGAFDPSPGIPAGNNRHVFTLSDTQPAAAAVFRGLTPVDQYRATNCLTSAIYYEAGNEPEDGQRAVAQVVLNRVRHPAWPHSVCGVVYQGSDRADTKCQFTFSCDGAMTRTPNNASWLRARSVAVRALAGSVYAPVGLATHYHTLAVRPNWASSLTPVAVIGAHVFYRWQGVAGMSSAFSVHYSGREVQSGPLPRTAIPNLSTSANIAPILTIPQASVPPMPTVAPDDSLPQSTVRAEFRNSGRPLH